MKKIIAFVLLLSLVGCTPPIEQPSSSEPAQKTLEILVPQKNPQFETIAKTFLKTATVKTQTDDYFDYLKIALTSDNAPTLFVLENAQQVKLLKDNIEELSGETWVNNACPNTLTDCAIDGKIYSMPSNIKGIGFVYNSDILTKAGINPENLNSLKRLYNAAQILSQRIENGEFKKEFPNLKDVFSIDEQTLSMFDDTYFEELEDFIEDFSINGGADALANEKTAVMLTDTDVYFKVKELNRETAEKLNLLPVTVDDKIEFKAILQTTHYWAINKNASEEQKKTAKEFLLWLYTKEGREHLNTLRIINPISTLDDYTDLPPLIKDFKTYADTAQTITLN